MKIGVKIDRNRPNPSGKVLVSIVLLFCLGHKANFHMVPSPDFTFQPITPFKLTVSGKRKYLNILAAKVRDFHAYFSLG